MANKRASRNAGKGGTFQKGIDSRRNTKGQTKKATVELSLLLKEYLTDEGLEETTIIQADKSEVKIQKAKALAKVIWNEALKGEFQFVQYICDRIMGKPSQPLEHSGEVSHLLSFKFGENGNGDAKE
jgi:hypothetical protein